jgi:tight adherence protein B
VGLTLLMFFTVTVGVAASFQLLSGLFFRDASLVRQRMADEFRKGSGDAPRSPLFRNLDRLSVDPVSGGMSDLGLAEMGGPPAAEDAWHARLQVMLEQADLKWSVQTLLVVMASLGLLLGALGIWLDAPLLGILLAAGAAAAPLGFVQFKRKVRRDAFLTQLPGAFDLMARVLRAGHSVPQALQAVVEASDQPVAGEFAQCQKQQNLGLRPEISFQDMARRTGVMEVRIFVMALLIQRQVGGNLAEVLERLAMLIRSRLRLRNHVRTLTAEGRLQGLTLLVLPFVMFGAMMVVNRTYAEVLFEHVPLLIAMGVSMAVGALWIRKIVNFEA